MSIVLSVSQDSQGLGLALTYLCIEHKAKDFNTKLPNAGLINQQYNFIYQSMIVQKC